MRSALYAAGMLVVFAAVTTPLSAGVSTVAPEIDGASMTTGLGLLAGGIMLIRARMRR